MKKMPNMQTCKHKQKKKQNRKSPQLCWWLTPLPAKHAYQDLRPWSWSWYDSWEKRWLSHLHRFFLRPFGVGVLNCRCWAWASYSSSFGFPLWWCLESSPSFYFGLWRFLLSWPWEICGVWECWRKPLFYRGGFQPLSDARSKMKGEIRIFLEVLLIKWYNYLLIFFFYSI